MKELRQELLVFSRDEVDKALFALEQAGAIVLGTGDLLSLSEEDREAALEDPRGPIVSVTAGNPRSEDGMPEAVCPDGSPSGDVVLDEEEAVSEEPPPEPEPEDASSEEVSQ